MISNKATVRSIMASPEKPGKRKTVPTKTRNNTRVSKAKPAVNKTASTKKTMPAAKAPAGSGKAVAKAGPEPLSPQFKGGFPIVGIGASAGGLKAFEELFSTDLNSKEAELKGGSRTSAKHIRELERELKTSKEELQSVNEELVTVNSELQNKIDELSKANNDINNLLSSTEIATMFLDEKLQIQRYTPAVTKSINLIKTDIGRPVSHIVTNLRYRNLVKDCEAVLDRHATTE